MRHFNHFTSGLKQFERRLFGLVLSSFVFSAISATLEYDHFPKSFLMLTSLVAGLCGIAGSLAPYLESLGNIHNAQDRLLRFQPSRSRGRMALQLLLSATSLIIFNYLATRNYAGCLIFACAATFLFFNALARAYLMMVTLERQEVEWRRLTVSQREEWKRAELQRIAAELERRKREIDERQALMKRIGDLTEITERLGTDGQALTRRVRQERAERRRKFIRNALSSLYQRSLNVRKKVFKGAFLLANERIEIEYQEAQAEEAFQEAMFGSLESDYRQIQRHEVSPILLETSGRELFRVNNRTYTMLGGEIKEPEAQQIIEDLAAVRDKHDILGKNLFAVIPSGSVVSFQARALFQSHQIEIFEPARDQLKAIEAP